MTARFRSLFAPVDNQWRDHFLTWLTALMLFHLFVLSPLELYSTVYVKAVAAISMSCIVFCIVVLARGVVPVAVVMVLVAVMATAWVLQVSGSIEQVAIYVRACAWLFISIVLIWVIVRAVYAPGPITYHRIVGAVMLYITIGAMFATIYVLIAALVPDAVRGITLVRHSLLPTDSVYFSFVTLTSVGYGDIYPVNPLFRALCNLEAIIGQLYPATLLARLVSAELRVAR